MIVLSGESRVCRHTKALRRETPHNAWGVRLLNVLLLFFFKMTVSHRVKKQLAYGSLAIVIFSGLAMGFYYRFLIPEPSCFDNLQNQDETGNDCGGVCIDCELKNIKSITVVRKEIVKATASKTSVLVEIENQNQNYGTGDIPIVITLLDSEGKEIARKEQRSFILPKEKKYFAEVGLDIVYSTIKEIQVDIGSFTWEKKEEILTPQLTVKSAEVKTQGKQMFIEGVAESTGAESFEKINILGIVRDKDGAILGFSKTELHGITGFSSAPFKIFMPDLENKMGAVVKSMTQVFIEPTK